MLDIKIPDPTPELPRPQQALMVSVDVKLHVSFLRPWIEGASGRLVIVYRKLNINNAFRGSYNGRHKTKQNKQTNKSVACVKLSLHTLETISYSV